MKTETYTCDGCGVVLQSSWYSVEVPEPRSEYCVEAAKHFCGNVCLTKFYYDHSWARDQVDIRTWVNK